MAPQTPADKKAARLAARRAVLVAADNELKVCITADPSSAPHSSCIVSAVFWLFLVACVYC